MHVVGTAGHVDHGKSTLVTALTGIDPDRFEEEKRRGLTIDLGFAWCSLPSGREIGIVDVPGHERFIRNMLAGVGSIDVALFVVAADEGWMPQSAEHLTVLDFLGIDRGVVALTKCDLVDDELRMLVADEVHERLAPTTLAGASIVPVSATTGAGLLDLRAALDGVLEHAGPADDRGRPRMFVDRSFTIAGAGTVVTGTLTGGHLRVGAEVTVLPGLHRARVRSLQTHRSSVDTAVPGSRVAANLVGLERTEVRRGDAIVTEPWILSDRFAARLHTARDLDHTVEERGAYELFVGSAQTRCRLKFLDTSGELGPRTSALVEIFTDAALPLVAGDRFVVRDVGRWETVAGGAVIDQSPPKLRRDDDEATARLRARESLRGDDLLVQILRERNVVGAAELRSLAGIGFADDTSVTLRAGAYIAPGFEETLAREAIALVSAYHAEHQLARGMPAEELRGALALTSELFADLLRGWDERGALVRDDAVVRRPDQEAALTGEQRVTADRALAMLGAALTAPPALHEVGVSLQLAKALERIGELVLIAPDIGYPSDVWQDIERRVVRLISDSGSATVAQVRDAVGTSRKYAVPMLEKLDATGVTRRHGDLRELGPRGRELAT